MRARRYTHTLFARPVRFSDNYAFLLVPEVGVEAKFDRAVLSEMAELLPEGRLWVQSNKGGRNRYLRLKPRKRGEAQNLMVSRLVVAFIGYGDLDCREVRHRNGNRWNFTAQNLLVSTAKRCRSTDRTHQAVAKWRWEARR